MNDPKKQRLLKQISLISAMERGKLSAYEFKERSGTAGPYHKLQQWHEGKNQTRYVRTDELPQVQAALEGYQRYQQLTDEYADLVIQETRESIADSKKKTRPSFSSPKTKKSNN